MGNDYTHAGAINYELKIGFEDSLLSLALTITTQTKTKKYKSLLDNESLPYSLKHYGKDIEYIYRLLRDKKNFEVDPARGGIILIFRSQDQREEKVKIKLQKIEQDGNRIEQAQPRMLVQSQTSSENWGQISEICFPTFNEGEIFEAEINIYRNQFEKWKREWAEKKKQILKKQKIKIGENYEYQGGMKNQKRHGLGISTLIKGQFAGDRYEGQFQNGCRHGKGIYYFVEGHRHEGQFISDASNGKGMYYWANGNWEEGEFKNKNRNGRIIFHFSDGRTEHRIYEDGKILRKE